MAPHLHIFPPASGAPGPLCTDSIQFVYFFLLHTSTNEADSIWPPSRMKSMTVKLTSIFGFKLFLSRFFFSLK